MNRRNFLIKGFLAGVAIVAPPFVNNNKKVYGVTRPKNQPEPDSWNNEQVTLSWIGHSTVLINFYGKWILTDPVMLERIGVYILGFTWGPSRYTAPAIQIEELPKPDIVLLSHAHMDHMDYLTLKKISKRFPSQIDFVTSFNTKDVIEDLPWKSIKELDWGDSYSINGVDITAIEVKHFGWRFPWEKDRSRGFKDGRSYNAYLLKRNGTKILFGGDTAYTDKFNVIENENVDIAIMPIGAYEPWRMNHCNPEEALKMAQGINAKYFVPIHCKTFQQGREPRNEPIRWLNKSVGNYELELGLNEIGQTLTV